METKTITFSSTLPVEAFRNFAKARGYQEKIQSTREEIYTEGEEDKVRTTPCEIDNPQTPAEYVANYLKGIIDQDIEAYQLLAVDAQFEAVRGQVKQAVSQLVQIAIS
jgi:hypothetical protein